MRVAVLLAIAGCTYQPGSFVHAKYWFPGQRTTVGCLDVAIERRADREGEAVLGYQFANRCDHAAIVDLAHVHVVGRTLDGAEHSLYAYDPLGQLRPLPLDGRLAGAEAIAYANDDRAPLGEVCVDAATISHADATRWLCFATEHAP